MAGLEEHLSSAIFFALKAGAVSEKQFMFPFWAARWIFRYDGAPFESYSSTNAADIVTMEHCRCCKLLFRL